RSDRAALIAQVFAAEADRQAREVNLAPEVAAFLEQYPWPGNIRELRHAARYAVSLCSGDIVTQGCLPDHLIGPERPSHASPHGGRAHVLQLTLERSRWNVSKAARLLGISRSTLHRQIRAYDLRRP